MKSLNGHVRNRVFLLFIVLCPLASCAAPEPETQEPSACLLGTYERTADINDGWRSQYRSRLEISPEHETHGQFACKVVCPKTPPNQWRATGLRKKLIETDWRQYEEIQLDVYNASPKEQKLFLEFRDAKKRSEIAFTLTPRKLSHIKLPLSDIAAKVVGGGRLDLSNVVLFSLYLICPQSEVVLFVDNCRLTSSREGPLRVPEVAQAIKGLRGHIAQIDAALAKIPDETVRQALAKQRTELDENARKLFADLAKPSAGAADISRALDAIEDLREKLEDVQKSACREKLLCAIKERYGDVDYGLAVETSMKKVFRDCSLFGSPLTNAAEVSLCRNEHEACQIIVIPLQQDLKGVYAEASDLVCAETGERIAKANITCFKVSYVKTIKPRYEVDYVGWWPDPLLDETVFDVKKDDILQPIWVDVYAPPETKGGTYEGGIEIRPWNSQPQAIKLRVNVWDFELPVEHHIKTAFSFSEGAYWLFYFSDYDRYKTTLPQNIRRRIYSWLLEHRVSPTNIYRTYDCSAIPHPDDLEFCIERGLDSFNIGRLQSSQAYGDYLRAYTKRLREKGWLKYAYIYGPDEIQYRTNYAEIKEGVKKSCKFVNDIVPGVPILAAIDIDPDLHGYINAWCPLTIRCDFELARKYQNAGDEVWWYWCAGGGHPGLYLDFPAIDPRIMFWLCWKYRIDGFLYYAINGWGGNLRRPPDKRWPIVDWDPRPGFDRNAAINGSGVLVYPGRKFGELLSSTRFENIRDGLEDYEYLWRLEAMSAACAKTTPDSPLIEEAQSLLRMDSVAKSVQSYTREPSKLLSYRARVAQQIERLSRALNVSK